MEIIRFLKDQHEEAKDLLNEIMNVQNDASESRSLLEKISEALRLHMQIEETILYPAASRCFAGDHRKPSVLKSLEEHELARHCLSALESTPPTDEHFVARAKVLKGILREHMLDEQSELFPSLATKLGQSGIDMLGAELEHQMPQLEAESASRPAKQAAEAESAPRPAKQAAADFPVTTSRGAKVAQTTRRRAAILGAKRHGAKVAQTTRRRAAIRGAKGSRRQGSTSRSATRH
jgi:iron-sulfur cluster repair protein YtfE (RIC family)